MKVPTKMNLLTKTNEETVELLSVAYSILDGIPRERIDLGTFQYDRNRSCWTDGPIRDASEIGCGTLACGGGWISLHPYFQELGLYVKAPYGDIQTRHIASAHDAFDALAHTFSLTPRETAFLFESYGSHYGEISDELAGTEVQKSDKALWLWRCKFLIDRIKSGIRYGS